MKTREKEKKACKCIRKKEEEKERE